MEKLNSDGYLSIVVNILESHKLTENIYFMCTDGAPVVCSNDNGLYGKLRKHHLPHLIAHKCIAHQTSLGAKELAK